MQSIYGDPGSDSSLETVYNSFTNALQALSTSPDDSAARSAVISAAQLLAQSLNATSDGIQALRGEAEIGIADAVGKANEAMSQIAKLNQQIATLGDNSTATAAMLDQRDSYIDQLSQLMDINVIKTGNRRQHLHQFRRPAGRQPGRADVLRSAAAPLRRPRAGAPTRPSARSARSS